MGHDFYFPNGCLTAQRPIQTFYAMIGKQNLKGLICNKQTPTHDPQTEDSTEPLEELQGLPVGVQ